MRGMAVSNELAKLRSARVGDSLRVVLMDAADKRVLKVGTRGFVLLSYRPTVGLFGDHLGQGLFTRTSGGGLENGWLYSDAFSVDESQFLSETLRGFAAPRDGVTCAFGDVGTTAGGGSQFGAGGGSGAPSAGGR